MLRVFFSLFGRIGRRNFLLVQVINGLIWFVLFKTIGQTFADHLAEAEMMGGYDAMSSSGKAAFLQEAVSSAGTLLGVGLIVFLVTFWTDLASHVKRLHDFKVSGWWVLARYFSPLVALAVVMIDPKLGPLALVLYLVPSAMFLACLLFPGTWGPNAYGQDRLSIFDLAARTDETWEDRVSAHKASLKGEALPEPQAKAAKAEPSGPRRRTGPTGQRSLAGRSGFGRRGG